MSKWNSLARGRTLQHIHLTPPPPARRPGAFPTYDFAVRAQTVLQQRLLAWKAEKAAAAAAAAAGPAPAPPPPPAPMLLSFTPAPTYTLGRRQTEPLGPDETARLTRPLEVPTVPTTTTTTTQQQQQQQSIAGGRLAFAPSVHLAPRGGLATYHGPGQLVLWPIIDLHSPAHRHLTVRGYACLLEKTTMAALRLATSTFGRPQAAPLPPGGGGESSVVEEKPDDRAAAAAAIAGFTDPDNPGVWVDHRTFHPPPPGRRDAAWQPTGEARKIAALGVHLRRHVTGLGVAINCDVAVDGPDRENPWSRIVPCGIEGKRVTSVLEQMGGGLPHSAQQSADFIRYLTSCWARLFAQRLYDDAEGQVVDVDPKTLGLDLEEEGNWVAGIPLE